jgi:protein-tyrosine kinase
MGNGIGTDSLESIRYTKTRTVDIDPERLRENRVVMGLYHDYRADIFRVLRTNVLRQLRENDWNSFAVTSATPGAGKTFVSVNLGIAIALESNQSVLIVDADFRRPLVGHYLGIKAEFGLADCLTGRTSLEDCLINPGFNRLVVLPGRESSRNASELASSPKMAKLIQEIRSRYQSRIIIFDIPPLFVADDALLLLPHVDGALLVAEDEKNTPEELQHSIHVLEQTNLLGLILNKSRQPLPRYHSYSPVDGEYE